MRNPITHSGFITGAMRGIWATLAGGAMLTGTAVAQTVPPSIYYSWRAMATSVSQCIDQAESALASQNLDPVQTDAMSIAGQSDDATAVFVCMENPTVAPNEAATTTVMVIVASADDEQAMALREALKLAF